MSRTRHDLPRGWLHLAPVGAQSLQRQLYDALRAAILGGQLPPGARLPGSRALAESVGVSRTTAVIALDQLHAEGYLQRKPRTGTVVSPSLPDDALRARESARPSPAATGMPGRLSQRGHDYVAAQEAPEASTVQRAFADGLPALDEFPAEEWARLSARAWRKLPARLLGYGSPAGYGPLRQAIAARLQETRAIRCTEDQVVIVSGVRQAIEIAAQLLLDRGDGAWVEDPGYPAARETLQRAGATLEPVEVDGEGLIVARGEQRAPRARLAYVTPSHQFPLGVTLSLRRRLALLDWARRAGAWIIEDDYDNEFRYTGRPLAALHSLDPERVLYVGTFSKTLAPALRMGFLVAPPALAPAFIAARGRLDRQSAMVDQVVLADFMAQGHYARHVRRMRLLYEERQRVLIAAARQCALPLELEPCDTGLQLVGWLPRGRSDAQAALSAEAMGVATRPISAYSARRLPRGGLLLGYAAVADAEIERAVRVLKRALG